MLIFIKKYNKYNKSYQFIFYLGFDIFISYFSKKICYIYIIFIVRASYILYIFGIS